MSSLLRPFFNIGCDISIRIRPMFALVIRSQRSVTMRSFSTSNIDTSATSHAPLSNNQSTNQSSDQSSDLTDTQSRNQTINQSIDRPSSTLSTATRSDHLDSLDYINRAIGQSIDQSLKQAINQSPNDVDHDYSRTWAWTCRICSRRHNNRVHCQCGETNKSLQLRQKLKRESAIGKAAKQRAVISGKRRRRETTIHVRKQVTQKTVHTGTCEWDGCKVPMHLLSVFRLDPSLSTKYVARMTPRQKLSVVDRSTVDGKVMLRCLCPVHHQLADRERRLKRFPDSDPTALSQKSTTRWRQQKKLQLKHCTHDHCYHPDIPECNPNTMDLFGLVHILDEATWRELNIDERAKPIDIHSNSANENRRMNVMVPELDKCRLMHLTCARDHRDRQKIMSIDEKRKMLRADLPALPMPDWYRDAIVEVLDRHDAVVAAAIAADAEAAAAAMMTHQDESAPLLMLPETAFSDSASQQQQ